MEIKKNEQSRKGRIVPGMLRIFAPLVAFPLAIGVGYFTNNLETVFNKDLLIRDRLVHVEYKDPVGARKPYIEAKEDMGNGRVFVYKDISVDGILDKFTIIDPKYFGKTSPSRNYISAEGELIQKDRQERYDQIYLELQGELGWK